MSLGTSITEDRKKKKHTPPTLRIERGFSSRVRLFLKKNVPPSALPISEEWRTEARSLGEKAVPLLLKALRDGNDAEQYSALITLRENGIEAWGHGYDADFEYHVTVDGEKRIIKPVQGDMDAPE